LSVKQHFPFAFFTLTELSSIPMPTGSGNNKRMSRLEHLAILAEVGSGKPQRQVAKQFGVSKQTVNALVKEVREAVTVDSLEPVVSVISRDAKLAIQRSVNDLVDVHKAAATGLSWLKGTGELQPDGGNVNVFSQTVVSLGTNWRQEYVTGEGEVIELGSPTSKEEGTS
jgi:hypothetical protein